MRILYVDDHAPFRAVVQRRFLAMHEVVGAPNLTEARRHLSEGKFDAVMVDEAFPDGNGAELVSEIVSRKTCPVIAVSASPEAVARLVEAGAVAAINKSEFTRLAVRLESILGGTEPDTMDDE